MNISNRLQELLEKTSTSRTKLARALGVHTSTVSNWLDGKEPKLENLADIARYFGVSTDYLTGAAEGGPAATAPGELDAVYYSLAKKMQSEGIHPDDIQYFIDLQRRARQRHDKS